MSGTQSNDSSKGGANGSADVKSDHSRSLGSDHSRTISGHSRSPASPDGIRDLRKHSNKLLEEMENAKNEILTPSLAPGAGGKPLTPTSSQDSEDSSLKGRAEASTNKRPPRPPTATDTASRGRMQNGDTDEEEKTPKAKSKPKIDLKAMRGMRGKSKNQAPSSTQTRSRLAPEPPKMQSKTRRNSAKSLRSKNRNEDTGEDPPKTENETTTDATHVEGFAEDHSNSSIDLKRDDTDKEQENDPDQECDSSSSSASGTQKTDGGSGMLDNEKGDKIISASRFVFFAILGVTAIVISSLTYWIFAKQNRGKFEEAFTSASDELKLYTSANVDAAFASLQGLSFLTTSVIKRTANESQFPAGFIEMPDINYNLGLAKEVTEALVVAYMPRVNLTDYRKWEIYSSTHKNWISREQKDGPLDIEPEITDFIWEYRNYDFEDENPNEVDKNKHEVRALDDVDMDTFRTGLRGIGRGQSGRRLVQKPPRAGGCSDNIPQRREKRRLDSAGTDDNFFSFVEEFDDDGAIGAGDDWIPPPSTRDRAPRDDEFQTPVWQITPVPIVNETQKRVDVINYNLADRKVFADATEYMDRSRDGVFLDVCDHSAWFMIEEHKDVLQTVVAYPVLKNFTDETVVGYYAAVIPWKSFFKNNNNRKDGQNITVVVDNSCGETFTVLVPARQEPVVLGEGDLHDRAYDSFKNDHTFTFAEKYNNGSHVEFKDELCIYSMTVYPTNEFEAEFRNYRPLIISFLMVVVFILTSFAFMLFDCLVTRRQNKLLNTAMRQNAIVASLFPKNVQKKLMEQADAQMEADERKVMKKRNLTTFLNDDQRGRILKADPLDSKPIADLFPNTTIMFADISGFTAWSSAREPASVFTLLETIYQAFDEIAKRRRVFKVEVVGDCYVAVCGLPDPRKDHYAVMCRFAQDCMAAMHVHTKELEVRLGPDTGDLSLRVGLHSGPVVAGVLRGDKSRFQLFGDTMNTASRMESTGVSNRIQLSQATADLLILNGKEHWITKRQDKVQAKGKGELTTYFLLSVKRKTSSTASSSTGKLEEVVLVKAGNNAKTVQKRNRVADWVVEMLGKLLKEMKAKRKLTGVRPDNISTIEVLENESVGAVGSNETTVIDEVSECLMLPGLIKSTKSTRLGMVKSGKGVSTKPSAPATLDKEVIDELQHYVYSIAALYQKNPFHNFEHASHVSMSCIKLLNRIASHDEEHMEQSNHHTYGICSDPLTSFGIVFSALIHDVDHCGVPNAQLVKERSAVATMYKNKSVAEQNSIDIGWGLLMEPTYANLRRHIYTTVHEYKCFRQIVVNCIMATDICDRDLIKARNKRWDLAFSQHSGSIRSFTKLESEHRENMDRQISYRKATVVIEHLIQLSDVSHTMQHWHMYRRWNERLFEESYVAFVENRAEKNPADNWYQGELGFYDFYIIPLAKKIKQCAVFGVSSDEYLSYAKANRQEWEERGKEVVKEMVKKMETLYHSGSSRQLRVSDKEVEESKESENENLEKNDTSATKTSTGDKSESPEGCGPKEEKNAQQKDSNTSQATSTCEASDTEKESSSHSKDIEASDVAKTRESFQSMASEDSFHHEEYEGLDSGDRDELSRSTNSAGNVSKGSSHSSNSGSKTSKGEKSLQPEDIELTLDDGSYECPFSRSEIERNLFPMGRPDDEAKRSYGEVNSTSPQLNITRDTDTDITSDTAHSKASGSESSKDQ